MEKKATVVGELAIDGFVRCEEFFPAVVVVSNGWQWAIRLRAAHEPKREREDSSGLPCDERRIGGGGQSAIAMSRYREQTFERAPRIRLIHPGSKLDDSHLEGVEQVGLGIHQVVDNVVLVSPHQDREALTAPNVRPSPSPDQLRSLSDALSEEGNVITLFNSVKCEKLFCQGLAATGKFGLVANGRPSYSSCFDALQHTHCVFGIASLKETEHILDAALGEARCELNPLRGVTEDRADVSVLQAAALLLISYKIALPFFMTLGEAGVFAIHGSDHWEWIRTAGKIHQEIQVELARDPEKRNGLGDYLAGVLTLLHLDATLSSTDRVEHAIDAIMKVKEIVSPDDQLQFDNNLEPSAQP